MAGSTACRIDLDHQRHSVRIRVYVHRLTQQNLCIFLRTEHASERRRYIARRKRTRRDLIKKRLKKVEIAAIEKRYLNRGALQLLGRQQPAEATA